MRMITQYFEPDGGSVRFDGTPLADAGIAAKRRIGFLPENNPLYGEMLVSEYLDFVARLRELNGPERKRAIDESVNATAIDGVYNRPISELSKGFRQRVGLAAAILHRPDLLVLDEPTEGLDPNQRVEIRQLISHLGRERTVMLSTHVLGEVQYTCSRLLIINKGKIVADDAVDRLLSRATAGVRISVEAEGRDLESGLAGLPDVRSVEPHESTESRRRFTIVASAERDVRPDVFNLAKDRGWTLYELHQEAGSLEDLFRELTGASAGASAL
jgi:ABC-2 type transport system ATP-binding protein